MTTTKDSCTDPIVNHPACTLMKQCDCAVFKAAGQCGKTIHGVNIDLLCTKTCGVCGKINLNTEKPGWLDWLKSTGPNQTWSLMCNTGYAVGGTTPGNRNAVAACDGRKWAKARPTCVKETTCGVTGAKCPLGPIQYQDATKSAVVILTGQFGACCTPKATCSMGTCNSKTMQKKVSAAKTACNTTAASCGESVCCEPITCGKVEANCDAGSYQDTGKAATAVPDKNSDLGKKACCTAVATCANATCEGMLKKAGASATKCKGAASSCTTATCCEAKCGTTGANCSKFFSQDPANKDKVKGSDGGRAACCTATKCGKTGANCSKFFFQDSAKETAVKGTDGGRAACCTATKCGKTGAACSKFFFQDPAKEKAVKGTDGGRAACCTATKCDKTGANCSMTSFQDPAKETVVKGTDGGRAACCTEKATCSQGTCTGGKVGKASAKNTKCPMAAISCEEAVCCEAVLCSGCSKKVSTTVTMKGLDLDKCNDAVKTKLKKKVIDSFLASLSGYKAEDLVVTLSKGSVKATVVITPKAGSDVAALKTVVKAQAVAVKAQVLAEVKKMPEVTSGTIFEKGKSLADVTVDVEAPVEATAQPIVIKDMKAVTRHVSVVGLDFDKCTPSLLASLGLFVQAAFLTQLKTYNAAFKAADVVVRTDKSTAASSRGSPQVIVSITAVVGSSMAAVEGAVSNMKVQEAVKTAVFEKVLAISGIASFLQTGTVSVRVEIIDPNARAVPKGGMDAASDSNQLKALGWLLFLCLASATIS